MPRTVTIFMRDNNQTINYEIMQFLQKNIKTTTSCGNFIVPKIINKTKEEDWARSQHVSDLPAIIYQDKKYEGKKQIKKLIRQLCTTENFTREKTQDELDKDDLAHYQQDIIESTPDDEDDDTDDIENRKVQAAVITKLRAETAKQVQNKYHGRHNGIENMNDDTNMYIDNDDPNDMLLSERGNNINSEETDEDIAAMAEEEGGPDAQYMGALMEKMGVSTF